MALTLSSRITVISSISLDLDWVADLEEGAGKDLRHCD
jgi:hypothetical protein